MPLIRLLCSASLLPIVFVMLACASGCVLRKAPEAPKPTLPKKCLATLPDDAVQFDCDHFDTPRPAPCDAR